MTDKEIIKAIEHCKNNEGNGCRGCVFYGNEKGTCIDELLTDAFDLINRQQAEIERLTINMNAFGLDMKQEKERADTIRAEAIKECLNWVLSLFPEDKNFTTISRFTVNQKIKEMVGEQG